MGTFIRKLFEALIRFGTRQGARVGGKAARFSLWAGRIAISELGLMLRGYITRQWGRLIGALGQGGGRGVKEVLTRVGGVTVSRSASKNGAETLLWVRRLVSVSSLWQKVLAGCKGVSMRRFLQLLLWVEASYGLYQIGRDAGGWLYGTRDALPVADGISDGVGARLDQAMRQYEKVKLLAQKGDDVSNKDLLDALQQLEIAKTAARALNERLAKMVTDRRGRHDLRNLGSDPRVNALAREIQKEEGRYRGGDMLTPSDVYAGAKAMYEADVTEEVRELRMSKSDAEKKAEVKHRLQHYYDGRAYAELLAEETASGRREMADKLKYTDHSNELEPAAWPAGDYETRLLAKGE